MTATIALRELPHLSAFTVGHEAMDAPALLRAAANHLEELGDAACLSAIVFNNEIDETADHYSESITVSYEA